MRERKAVPTRFSLSSFSSQPHIQLHNNSERLYYPPQRVYLPEIPPPATPHPPAALVHPLDPLLRLLPYVNTLSLPLTLLSSTTAALSSIPRAAQTH